MDVPYVPEEWGILRDRAYAKSPNLNGMSVFGKYLSKMKLKQWKDKGWADTDKINALNKEKKLENAAARMAFDAEIKEQYEAGEISEAEYKTMISTQAQHEEYESRPIQLPTEMPQDRHYAESSQMVENAMQDIIGQLTQEDKTVLAMKWGALYQPQE